ncbi:MAG: RNA polymerase sigma factor SigZ [Pirellulales bacterium]|nr:RNA polymerase sigma factor SigZ [Pirellulales bacterium]
MTDKNNVPLAKELVEQYLDPLAALDSMAPHIKLGHKVVSFGRSNLRTLNGTSMKNQTVTTEQIWEFFGAKMKSFLIKRVSDPQVAEDLLQETFIRVHKKLGDLDDVQRMGSWVFQIVRNLVIDHYRANTRIAEETAERLEAEAQEDANLNDLVAGWLPQMIAQLPENYREAVELYELQGVPQQEIAERLGISLSGAKSRVQRGREKLKSILLDCCSFEQDRLGNLIGFSRNNPDEKCDVDCED